MTLGPPPGNRLERRGRRRNYVVALIIVVGAIGVIHGVRPALVSQFRQARSKHDTYALPSPSHVVHMSLGYRSALADLLMANVLVSSGIHLSERRRFEAAASYLRTINELDPKFATPYRFADSILTVQAAKATLEDYRSAREILERGMNELPFDMALWLSAGQFMAYVAPDHIEQLAGASAAKEWKQQGVMRMARSCELVGKDEYAPHQCAYAASLLHRAGEIEALRQFVERVVAVSDDPEVHQEALASLTRAVGESEKEKFLVRRKRYEYLRSQGLSFVRKDQFLLLGPHFDPFYCLSNASTQASECATSMGEFHRRQDQLDKLGS